MGIWPDLAVDGVVLEGYLDIEPAFHGQVQILYGVLVLHCTTVYGYLYLMQNRLACEPGTY